MTTYTSELDPAFADLDAGADEAIRQCGAAMVSTWEIALTDLGSALRGRQPETERAALLERLSDGLVPTQSPLRPTGERLRDAIQGGVRKALQTGQLVDATAPVGLAVAPLGGEVVAGWKKTVGYIDPVIVALPDADALRAALLLHGPTLGGLLDAQAAGLSAAMLRVGAAGDVRKDLLDAIVEWQRGCVRAIETTLYAARTDLVAAGRKYPTDT